VVDHLLVFKGQGEIKDFPGNYTQYREWAKMSGEKQEAKGEKPVRDARKKTAQPADATAASASTPPNSKRKLTYKEKRELEQLETEISRLETEQKQIEEALCGGTTAVDEITAMSKRLAQLKDELDEKSMRWLELAEISA